MNLAEFQNPATAHDDDKKLVVRFSFQPRIDSKRSLEEGRDCYRDVEFVTIRIPGDKTLVVNRPVMPSDKQRFPLQYAAFIAKKDEQLVGTPLALWPHVTESQRMELDYFNVRTVEQLAGMADGNSNGVLGIQALKRSAQNWLDAQKEAAPAAKLAAELAQRDDTIAALKDQLEKLSAKVDAQSGAPPKKDK